MNYIVDEEERSKLYYVMLMYVFFVADFRTQQMKILWLCSIFLLFGKAEEKLK